MDFNLNMIPEYLRNGQWIEDAYGFYDTVCAICDNGGHLIVCEGKCSRSFHAIVEDGVMCDSLGYSADQIVALWSQPFLCPNCQFKRHQCFGCGKLGSSDKSSGAAEVFQCACRACNYFYHPHCAAKWLYFRIGDQAKELEKEIAAGKPFICPLHACFACKRLETKLSEDPQMHFAVCRRCPKAYHRKCLPRDIVFEVNDNRGVTPRAWEGLLHNQILIYCLEHGMDDVLGTPIRNHLRFPH
ncbi:hypothetical protein ACH5RR_027827 [Cinchona calisaya]|uniref:Zinc finger PHD-type domain-containing protein n=1 Tax=Cinchona calisaya TaxID=153742 RepID=A0ABD2YND8_9GENT